MKKIILFSFLFWILTASVNTSFAVSSMKVQSLSVGEPTQSEHKAEINYKNTTFTETEKEEKDDYKEKELEEAPYNYYNPYYYNNGLQSGVYTYRIGPYYRSRNSGFSYNYKGFSYDYGTKKRPIYITPPPQIIYPPQPPHYHRPPQNPQMPPMWAPPPFRQKHPNNNYQFRPFVTPI